MSIRKCKIRLIAVIAQALICAQEDELSFISILEKRIVTPSFPAPTNEDDSIGPDSQQRIDVLLLSPSQ